MKDEKLAELVDTVRGLLDADGITLDDAALTRLRDHVRLVSEWNRVVGVVSSGEIEKLWERQVVDSLSLAPVLKRLGLECGHLLDIGSGGGFPAIPVKTIMPGLRVTLVERSEKKVGFLRKVVAALKLTDVTIATGEFPRVPVEAEPDAITARAVETPQKLVSAITSQMGPRTVFLSQFGVAFPSEFVVEAVRDAWAESGLRRGTLELVRRAD